MSEERKLVTILFADVTGSTMLGDALDPEDVRALMSRYYAHARRIVPDHGGTLEKFIGDAVMAIFGLPQAHGDDAERALAAALALRDAVAQDNILQESFVLRIGINTGEVIATNDPSKGEFLVTGDAVNVAARLQQHANPGEILVGERSVHSSRSAFNFSGMRNVDVRGKRQPLHAYTLKGACLTRSTQRPPLVGRKQDLLQLSVLLARALEEQRPQIVTVTAPAGTGKTRLLEDFLSQLDPADGFQVATMRCPPYGQTLAYWPLRGLLTDLLGGEICKTQITEIFLQGGYTQPDALRMTDFVLAALNMERERDGSIDRECIFMAWRFLIEVLAQQTPRILVIEDLHWASDNLLDLVEYLIHLRIQAPLLLIALSRPELLDRRPTWGGGRQNFTSLTLQPLTARQTGELVKHLVQDVSASIRERIVERSGGNPFFVLELVSGFLEQNPVEQAALDLLPDTIHGAILARIDRLTTQERRVLQAAAVKQRYFHADTLHALLDELSIRDVENALDNLLNHDLIAPGEGGSYDFRHMLIRDVAYGTLSRSERIRLHCKTAQWFETVAGSRLDEFAEPIATHYRAAIALTRQSAVPLELPIDCTRAIAILRRAGELAHRSGAFIEARSYLQSAIDIADVSQHIQLYEQLADCDLCWGLQAAAAYRSALACWQDQRVPDPLTGARLTRKLLLCYRRGMAGHGRQEFPTLLPEAQRLAEASGDEDELWHVRVAALFDHSCFYDGTRLSTEGIHEKKETALAAIAYFERKGDWTSFSEALDAYASLSKTIRAYHDMLEASQRRLTAPVLPALERGDAIQMIAQAYLSLGDYTNCIATIEKELSSLKSGQSLTYLNSGVAYALRAAFITGRWSCINTLADALKAMWEDLQQDGKTAVLLLDGFFVLLEIALAREEMDTVTTISSIITRICTMSEMDQTLLLPALLADDPQKLGEAFFNTPMPFNSMKHAGSILSFCNEHGKALSEAQLENFKRLHAGKQANTHYLEIAFALTTRDDAKLARAIDEAEAHDLVVHAARMRFLLARRTNDLAQLERARSVFEQLGDRQFLCKLKEVEAVLTK